MKYYSVYKPYGMLSQFSEEGKRATLSELSAFPRDVYPVGRLDADSEGLLILTNDKRVNSALLNPTEGHKRVYLVQVDGKVEVEAIEQIRRGVSIKVKGKEFETSPAECSLLTNEPEIPERIPPVRYRKNIPTSWLELFLEEGKNRQVRKMTAAIGHPTLRLVRWAIEDLTIEGMKAGDVVEWDSRTLFSKLKLRL